MAVRECVRLPDPLEEGALISVTLVKPASIDTPFFDKPDNLYAPVAHDGGERGRNWRQHTRESSLYTAAMLHGRLTAALAGAALAGAALAFRLGRRVDGGGPRRGRAGLRSPLRTTARRQRARPTMPSIAPQ
jgi:hypothetical protein